MPTWKQARERPYATLFYFHRFCRQLTFLANVSSQERVGLDLAPAQGDKLAVLMNYSETYWRFGF